jgi:murein DD-endopeptidase MepM/ murein hydrolase activator NlpD
VLVFLFNLDMLKFDESMSENLFDALPAIKVLQIEGKYIPLDLSVRNEEFSNLKTADEFEKHIGTYLHDNNATVAFGGYKEERNLYKRSGIFNDPDSEERNIHIGLDLWTKAGTWVLAALDGKVHSFDYNVGIGNYGPTIILEHEVNGQSFYTLYGHLTLQSIEDIEIGDLYKQGQQFAQLGDASVNGDYAPHLHFQIIMDIEDHFGDYPGVCSKSNLDHYLKNCPDPNLLLKLK